MKLADCHLDQAPCGCPRRLKRYTVPSAEVSGLNPMSVQEPRMLLARVRSETVAHRIPAALPVDAEPYP